MTRAGLPAEASDLIDVDELINAYYDRVPDPETAIASLDAPNDNARVGEWIRRFLLS